MSATTAQTTTSSMVSVTMESEYRIRIEETCGIAHERQIVTVPVPAEWVTGDLTLLTDHATGKTFPIQTAAAQPGQGFLLLALAPYESVDLGASPPGALPEYTPPVTLASDENGDSILANGRLALRLTNDPSAPGPVRGVRLLPEGDWRGDTFLDTRHAGHRWQVQTIEQGPLRTALRYSAALNPQTGASDPPNYEVTFVLDAGSDFVQVEENWHGNTPGDQIVWDFAGDDLPAEILRLDSTAGCTRDTLHYLFDRRLCRLFAWTQMSQLSDLSDGYALAFSGGDTIGFVALQGGRWRGNRLNHLEAWTRRWIGSDPASRRSVSDGAKRDAFPSPETIPAHGESRTTPHLNIEGWIGESGARSWALVVAKTEDLLPGFGAGADEDLARGCSPDRRHFEYSPDRLRDRRESSRLRRIHTQRGLLPLETLAGTVFRWPEEFASVSGLTYPDPLLEEHMRPRDRDVPPAETPDARELRRKRDLQDSLAARVYGFWEGGGSAATNPVVSRDIAPRMLQYEYLAREGKLTNEEGTQIRAWFAFLLTLFGSDNYYPGMATMQPVEYPDTVEPTLEGMANQNFYTDVVNIPGLGAQVFSAHPQAAAWRERFGAHWAQQLDYHVYPESGVWEESHTYFHHVLHTVLPTLLRRRDDGVGDAFADPALQRLVGGAVRQITPRDNRFGAYRYLVPFGDHSAGHHSYASLYKPYAEAFAPHAPVLAGHLAWMYREMGGTEPLAVDPSAPPCEPEYVQGIGYFLRGVDANREEFLLALRSGSAWGHHHQDDGSIQFWAKRRSRIVDAGFGEWAVGKRKFSDTGHSRWALTDFPAQNYLYRFNRGWITAQNETAPFPYAVAHAPVYLQNPAPQTVAALPGVGFAGHRRAMVRIGPSAFLVVDVAETRLAQTVRFHLPEMPTTPVEHGVVATDSDGCRLSLLSVLPDQSPLAVTCSDPLKDGKTTIEISAPVPSDNGHSRAIYLLAADDPQSALPSVSADAESVLLRGHGFAVTVAFVGEYTLRLRDTGSDQERLIDLSPPQRFFG